MREFKFRAFDGATMNYKVSVDSGKAVKYGYQRCSIGNTLINCNIMQYTGLRDKNGKEVYEGDILEGLGVVEYLENEARFCINIFGELHEVTFTELLTEELIVLGNIWENPKLLEEIKKELGE